jgi:putative FmdB family regulatory protein
MPEYTFHCDKCENTFSIVCSIKEYKDQQRCVCGSKASRSYVDDLLTLNTSVKKSNSELKTIGDLAKRNADKFSEDEKIHLYQKHNAYKFEDSKKELPTGMSRMKKPAKIKWPGAKNKTKRKLK